MLAEQILERTAKTSEEQSAGDLWASEESLLDSVLENSAKELQTRFPSLKEIQKKTLARIEKFVIEEALRRTKGNRKQAAQLLQISYKALLYKIKNFGVEIPSKNFPGDAIEVKLPSNMEPFV